MHFVTDELDGGPRILQAKVPVLENDTEDSLCARVQTPSTSFTLGSSVGGPTTGSCGAPGARGSTAGRSQTRSWRRSMLDWKALPPKAASAAVALLATALCRAGSPPAPHTVKPPTFVATYSIAWHGITAG
ncbi:protein containing Formyl transferase, partial [mine drainage metagenome]